MWTRRTGVVLLALFLGLALTIQAAYAVDSSTLQGGPALRQPLPHQAPDPAIQDAPAQRLNVPAVIAGEQLTKEQFNSLPYGAVIELNGSRTTAGELRAKFRQFDLEARARSQAAVPQVEAKFQAYRAKLLQQQRANLQDAHVKARTEVARLRQIAATTPVTQQEALQKESVELLNRSTTATPAEQQQIEQRALQLKQQLQQLKQAPR